MGNIQGSETRNREIFAIRESQLHPFSQDSKRGSRSAAHAAISLR